jgi:hypothetical protein
MDEETEQKITEILANASEKERELAEKLAREMPQMMQELEKLASHCLIAIVDEMVDMSNVSNKEAIGQYLKRNLYANGFNCHSEVFFNTDIDAEDEVFISIQPTNKNHNTTAELQKIEKYYVDDLRVPNKTKNGIFKLKTIYSRLMSGIHNYYKKFYLENKTTLDNLNGIEYPQLKMDPINTVWFLDVERDFRIGLFVELKSAGQAMDKGQ